MFAIVRTGGKQYRVAAGDKIVVEKLAGDAGDTITLGDVLLAGDGGELRSTDGLTVAAEIVAQAKGEKVIVFKKRRRHNYRRKAGHRQQYTILRITAIGDHKADNDQAAAPAKASTREAAASSEALVAQDGPAKIDGAESAMVDAPVTAKSGSETSQADTASAAEPTKVEPTESELVDAPKKKSTKKAKADKGGDDAAPADGDNQA